jgi:cytosine/adenosine deaminase-related metal-dependent hydrolase
MSSPPIADGAVLVEGVGREAVVRAVGPVADLARDMPPGARLVDHGEAVLLPGLVNAHTHLELSALAGSPPAADFGAWLAQTAAAAMALTREQAEPAIEAAIAACLATGTGLVGDVTDHGFSVPALARSPLSARVYHEVMGFDPRQAEPALAAAREQLAAGEVLGAGEALAVPHLRHSLAPHAPYSVSMRLLRLIRGVNAQDGRPTAIHLAESAAEDEFFQSGEGPIQRMKERLGTVVDGYEPPGETSVQWLARLGWFEAPQLAVHATQLSARGIEILRRAPVTVCLCPRSNRALGVGAAPARAMAEAGIPLALGTDSLASVPNLSMFDELAAAAEYGLEPAVLLRAATYGGAAALGFGTEHGAIASGRPAHLLAVAAPEGVRMSADPYALLLGQPDLQRVSWAAGPAANAAASVAAAHLAPARGEA